MKDDILAMFEQAYRDRSPLFGLTPTRCVVTLSEMLPPDSRVADIGCGDGRDSLFLLERGFMVTAIDLSNNALAALGRLAKTKGLASRLETIVGSVMDWDPAPSSFDAVIGITILDHLPKQDHERVFRSITVALNSGGLIALEMHSDRDPCVSNRLGAASEFVCAIQSFAPANYLLSQFLRGWRILDYSDRIELDNDHGRPHKHGFVTLVAQKEIER